MLVQLRTNQIADLQITNAKIAASAGIPESKLADLGKEGFASLLENIQNRTAFFAPFAISETHGVILDAPGGDAGKVKPQAVPDMTVQIDTASTAMHLANGAGNGNFDDIDVTASVVIGAADVTNPRYDVVVVAANGSIVVRAGTPGATPALPALVAGDVILAVVKVAANATEIGAAAIFDHRRWFGNSQATATRTNSASTTMALPYRLHNNGNAGPRLQVYKNGLRLAPVTPPTTADEYTAGNDTNAAQIEANGTVITFGAALELADVILVDYVY